MFGYINVNSKELSDQDKKIYNAYYCGLCQSLKKICGKKGQVLLSYDMTFLQVLLSGLYEPEEKEWSFTCALHPAKKKKIVQNEISDYVAAMNLALAYHSCMDDWEDNKKYTRKTMAGLIRKDYQNIVDRYPRQINAIEKYIHEIGEIEKRQERNIDMAAGATGDMMSELFAWKEDEWQQELRSCGYYLGKYIYLMDAYDDLDKDRKNGNYNPMLFLSKEDPENYETVSRLMMTSMISECAKSFERMPILKHADILRNILYSGVWSRYEYIQIKKRNKK